MMTQSTEESREMQLSQEEVRTIFNYRLNSTINFSHIGNNLIHPTTGKYLERVNVRDITADRIFSGELPFIFSVVKYARKVEKYRIDGNQLIREEEFDCEFVEPNSIQAIGGFLFLMNHRFIEIRRLENFKLVFSGFALPHESFEVQGVLEKENKRSLYSRPTITISASLISKSQLHSMASEF
jgi:hypothetical protein